MHTDEIPGKNNNRGYFILCSIETIWQNDIFFVLNISKYFHSFE